MERENAAKPVAFNVMRHLMIPLMFLKSMSMWKTFAVGSPAG